MVERTLRPALHVTKSAKTSAPKLFVLDTNVLMHDPTSLLRFEEHDIYLPILILEELDNNKKGTSEVARNARQATPRPDGCSCRPRRSRPRCRHRLPAARRTTRSSPW